MFLNSDNRFFGFDYFDDPGKLHDYLRGEKVLADDQQIDEPGLGRLRVFRDSLRAYLAEPDAVESLNAVTAGIPLVFRVGFREAELQPQDPSDVVNSVAAAMLGMLHRAVVDGRWVRMHICQRPDCQWVYYDSSRNKSARWCSADPCGDVMKARAWRARQRGH